jgi:hypothetical protein
VLLGRHTILRNSVANFMFDYNTAEAVLLSSALLINLGGICFDSSRFAGAQIALPGRQAEYDSLAFAIIAIMFLSIIYFFAALGMDLLLVTAPQSVQACLSSFGEAGKQALKRAKAAAAKGGLGGDAAPPSTSSVGGGGGGSKRLRVIGGVEEAAADPNAVSMQANALMVAELARGGAGAAGAGGAPKDLGKLGSELPDAASWPSIRTAVAAADRRAKDLAVENERLRERLAEGGGGGGGEGSEGAGGAGGAGGAVLQRARKAAFSPTNAGGGKTGDAKDALKAAAAGRASARALKSAKSDAV